MKTAVVKQNFSIVHYFRAYFAAFLVTLILMALAAAVIYFSGADDSVAQKSAAGVKYISAAVAGFLCAHGATGRGYLRGGAAALLYMIILCLAGIMISGTIPSVSVLKNIGIGMFCGAFGGIVGINCK